MRDLLVSRTTAVWALLVVATLVSWQLGHGVGFDTAKTAGVAILIVTFAKVRFVMLDFMELRSAPRWMRRTGQGWILLIGSQLIVLFLHGPR